MFKAPDIIFIWLKITITYKHMLFATLKIMLKVIRAYNLFRKPLNVITVNDNQLLM